MVMVTNHPAFGVKVKADTVDIVESFLIENGVNCYSGGREEVDYALARFLGVKRPDTKRRRDDLINDFYLSNNLSEYALKKKSVASGNRRSKSPRKESVLPFEKSQKWITLRYKALLKYGRRCLCCGATPETGAVMHVDHIRPKSKYPELALDINNLQILCGDCNFGKGNRDETDFRALSHLSAK